MYIFMYPSQSIWHTLIVQLPLPFGSKKDNQELVSARRQHCTATKCRRLAVHSVILVILAARCAVYTASASPQPFRLAMSLSRMAQTPYAGHPGEAPLRVLERLPHSSRHTLFLTSASPRPVHVVIPSPYAAQSTPIPLASLPYGHARP